MLAHRAYSTRWLTLRAYFACVYTPGMLCNYQSTGRHGWVRLTHSRDANGQEKYHLYICTVNGWKPITSDSGGAGR